MKFSFKDFNSIQYKHYTYFYRYIYLSIPFKVKCLICDMIICCWNCCETIASTSEVSIIVFYDDKRNIIIKFGSSEIGHHIITANIHAEEIAMKQLRKYIIKNQLNYTKYKKHIKLIIWKKKSDIEILPAQCCSW